MMKKAALLTVSLLALAGCESTPDFNDAQYWQRVDSTSALFLQGPKAQQTLHENISTCVATVNELTNLGSLKEAIPRDLEHPDESELNNHDTPRRKGYRYAEHLEYTDFETCMYSKGWERVDHLPYDVAERSRDTYIETIIGKDEYKKPSGSSGKTSIKARERDPYKDLNE